jgi:hypothetical protein
MEGHGKPNLQAFITNREDWQMSRRITDQSIIKQAIHTFKTYKSAGADEFVPALLQQGINHLYNSSLLYFKSLSDMRVHIQGDVYP